MVAESREQWSAFARLTVVVMLRSIVFFGLNTFIPLYWSHVLHGSKAGGGYALTTMFSAVVTGTLIGGRMADRYGRKVVVAVSLAALSPLLFLFLSAHGLARRACSWFRSESRSRRRPAWWSLWRRSICRSE